MIGVVELPEPLPAKEVHPGLPANLFKNTQDYAPRLGPDLEVEEVLESPPVPASPTDHQLFRALEATLELRAPVVPSFLTGTTDSRYFRQRGIPAYGFSPFAINAQDLRGIHGRDESVPVDAFLRGIETLKRFLAIYAGEPGF